MHSQAPMVVSAGAPGEWRLGWTVVLAAFFGVSVVAIQNHTMGVLIKPLSQAYGWSRAEIAVAPLIVSVGALILAPVVGYLVDRLGARRIALWGVPIFAAVLSSIGFNGGNLVLFYALFACLAVINPAVGPVTWSLGVASRFERHRGLALGIAMAGMSALGTISPLYAQLAYEQVGIDLVWIALGALALVVGFPLTLLFFYDANDLRGRSPADTEKTLTAGRAPVASPHDGLAFAQAIGSGRFWQLAVALGIAASVCGFFTYHFASMLTDRGMSAREAAMVMGVMAPATMAGRIAGGYLLDRFFAPRVGAVLLLLPMVACLLMLVPGTSTFVSIAVGLSVGFALGSEGDVVAYLTARYFGLGSYGRIYGVLIGLYSVGFGLGSFIGGSIFEATGAYRGAFMLFLVILPIAGALLVSLGDYPEFGEKDDLDIPPGRLASGDTDVTTGAAAKF